MDEGKVDYIVYTGKTDMDSIDDYIRLHHHAILLGITTLTSLDTANALADIIASRFNENNTELVTLRAAHRKDEDQVRQNAELRQRLYFLRQYGRKDHLVPNRSPSIL